MQNFPFKIKKDLVFVTDRDGNAIHVFTLPDFNRVGLLDQIITRPMGISLYQQIDPPVVYGYIVPKEGEGNAKVLRFQVDEQNGKIIANRQTQFGKELAVGQETVMVNAEHKRVLIADEKPRDVKVYDLDGKFLRTFGGGIFGADVEGIALSHCGYVIVTDQQEITELNFFDRESLRHLATVKTMASRTDGIALTPPVLTAFPGGLFVAQSDPDDAGGRHAEYYRFNDLLKSAGLPDCN